MEGRDVLGVGGAGGGSHGLKRDANELLGLVGRRVGEILWVERVSGGGGGVEENEVSRWRLVVLLLLLLWVGVRVSDVAWIHQNQGL